MNKYTVEITETLQQQFEIEAENASEAIQKTKEEYGGEEIVLMPGECNVDVEFDLIAERKA